MSRKARATSGAGIIRRAGTPLPCQEGDSVAPGYTQQTLTPRPLSSARITCDNPATPNFAVL